MRRRWGWPSSPSGSRGGRRPQAEHLHELQNILRERFGIDHTTIQVEPEEMEEGGLAV
jgi:hypothetical protein